MVQFAHLQKAPMKKSFVYFLSSLKSPHVAIESTIVSYILRQAVRPAGLSYSIWQNHLARQEL